MGRGRAKAKQTRVARDLKYRTYETDFSSLERELRGEPHETNPDAFSDEDDTEDDDYPHNTRQYG